MRIRLLSGFQVDICASTSATASCMAAVTGAASKPGGMWNRADQRVPRSAASRHSESRCARTFWSRDTTSRLSPRSSR